MNPIYKLRDTKLKFNHSVLIYNNIQWFKINKITRIFSITYKNKYKLFYQNQSFKISLKKPIHTNKNLKCNSKKINNQFQT